MNFKQLSLTLGLIGSISAFAEDKVQVVAPESSPQVASEAKENKKEELKNEKQEILALKIKIDELKLKISKERSAKPVDQNVVKADVDQLKQLKGQKKELETKFRQERLALKGVRKNHMKHLDQKTHNM